MKNRTRREKAIIRRRIFIASLSVILAAVIALLSIVVVSVVNNIGNNSSSSVVDSTIEIKPEPKTATIINTGDILVHTPVLGGAKTADGNYDFSAFFIESEKYFKAADYATVNFEVTLGGNEKQRFDGYPMFNTPDSILDTIKSSGIDMVTTANNHCYDTGYDGLIRTAQQMKLNGIDFIGTKEFETDPTYLVKDINGIKIGMVAFTYENAAAAGRKSINGNLVRAEANNLINSFSYERIEEFYTQAQSVVDGMKNNGAEAFVFYMHWGEEYQLTPNKWQKTIAQKLCNMGVDVIVGAHPHVVQPIELLHSEDSQNTTVCIYSMGNSISNQRQELMDSCPSGHTEDGVLFSYTFTKDSDGVVSLTGVDVIPTWVNKYPGGSGYQYTMYPLETADMANNYQFGAAALRKAMASFERTKKLVAPGLTECQKYLGCKVRFEEEVTENSSNESASGNTSSKEQTSSTNSSKEQESSNASN